MYKFVALNDKNKSEWESLAAGNLACGFNQSFVWSDFKATQRWSNYKVGLLNEITGKIEAGAIIYRYDFKEGYTLLSIPEGPVLNYESDLAGKQWEHLKMFIKKIIADTDQPVVALRIEPRLEKLPIFFADFNKALKNLLPTFTNVIDLRMSEEELLARMKPKGRYNIKLASKKGVVVKKVELTKENLVIFYNLYDETARRSEIPPKSQKLFLDFGEKCGERGGLFFAMYESEVLAAAVTFGFGKEMTYLYGASSNEKKDLMASYLLQWQMIKTAKANGYFYYDLHGCLPVDFKGSHPWQGISQFKRKFGGKQKAYIGAYDWIIAKSEYKQFVSKYET